MDLDRSVVDEIVARCLAEDVGGGDVTTSAVISPAMTGRARIEARQETVVAGLDVARACFEQVERGPVGWEPEAKDGDTVATGAVLVRIVAPIASILTAERTALNLLAHMCGVATNSARFAAAVRGSPVRVVDTRKTTPGLRVLEKYAVRVGGCHNHRFGLYDAVLIKDNHVAAAGGVAEAVEKAKAKAPKDMLIEVEVADLEQLEEALAAGAGSVLLDNMSPSEVSAAVARNAGRAILEVSGGITLANISTYAATGVDLISTGALTHSAPSIDLALEMEA